MIALLVLLTWLDQSLQGTTLPEEYARFSPNGESIPRGTIVFLVIAFASIMAAGELATILRANNIQVFGWLTRLAAFTGLITCVAIPFSYDSGSAVAVVGSATVLILLLSMVFSIRRQSIEGVVASAGGTLFAYVYLGMLFGFLLLIRRQHTAWVLLAIVLITKSCDIGAYFVGTFFGKHKMVPWLSPKKTWEGLAGGLATSAGVGALASFAGPAMGLEFTWIHGLVAGLLFGLFGQAGDLIASVLKRDAGIKDSARSLPGFGGFLDVIDSPLLAGPVAYWLLTALAYAPE